MTFFGVVILKCCRFLLALVLQLFNITHSIFDTKQHNQATDLIKMFKCDSLVKLIRFLCGKNKKIKLMWMDRVGITQL